MYTNKTKGRERKVFDCWIQQILLVINIPSEQNSPHHVTVMFHRQCKDGANKVANFLQRVHEA